jgi:hypothetical protein
MEAPVVVKGAIDAQLAELPVIDTPDLHAQLPAGRAHDPHAPRQPAFRIGYAQWQQPRATAHGKTVAHDRAGRSTLLHRAAVEHARRRDSDRPTRQHQGQRHCCRVQPA